MKEIIDLADALECPAAVIVFHNRYWARLTGIKTVNQRNDALSDMQQDFEKEVREEPQIRN